MVFRLNFGCFLVFWIRFWVKYGLHGYLNIFRVKYGLHPTTGLKTPLGSEPRWLTSSDITYNVRSSAANRPPTPALSARGSHPVSTVGALVFQGSKSLFTKHAIITWHFSSVLVLLTRYCESFSDKLFILLLLYFKHLKLWSYKRMCDGKVKSTLVTQIKFY